MTDQQPKSGWKIPSDYYDDIGFKGPNPVVHKLGRMLITPHRFALHGAPVIDTAPEFDEMRESGAFQEGNIIVAAVHRSGKETIYKPDELEKLGLHHARPLTKKESNMDNPLVRWGMHKLGAFAVDTQSPNTAGVTKAQGDILNHGGIITIYIEGTRKYLEIDMVTAIKLGVVITAIENDSLIIPQATAGMSKLKVGEKPNRRTVAKDRIAPFGRDPHNPFKKGLPLVFAFGKPFKFDKPDFTFSMSKSAGRIVRSQSTDYVRECAEILRQATDSTIKRAYEVRGSMLEDRLDV